MSHALPARPRIAATKRTFVIVASQYNPDYVQGLIDHVKKELQVLAPYAATTLVQVPGSFEIPLAVQEVARKGGIDAIIALGVIFQGATGHAGHIAEAITGALMQISLANRVPVIHEVLTVNNDEQAKARCLGEEINRGTEAARAAVRIASVMNDLKGKS
ncbi:MAG TPA: 6,7-dimethyl-8-ribityllumazine synthase [Chthoniobacterales bacterium]